MIVDCFPFAGSDVELLLLECRLTELYDVVDYFVIVEAKVDHQNNPKPLNFLDNEARYLAWLDKIMYVVASDMPDTPHLDDPWCREHAQREYMMEGLDAIGVSDSDLVLQSDVDEIPRPLFVRNLRLRGNERVSFRQRGHFWAIDWLYPDPPGWSGTVGATVAQLRRAADQTAKPFTAMRNTRNANTTQFVDAGWHFSWLGRAQAAQRKIDSFCHPEVVDHINEDLDWYWREGWHLGGGDNKAPVKMIPVDVDKTWPRWMQDPTNVPPCWYRPRKAVT